MTVQRLNEHPLNRAALRRLRQEQAQADPRSLHLLSLAQAGLQDRESNPLEGDDPARLRLADYDRGVLLQQSALSILEGALEPEEVLRDPLPQLAERISQSLRAVTPDSP